MAHWASVRSRSEAGITIGDHLFEQSEPSLLASIIADSRALRHSSLPENAESRQVRDEPTIQ
jgi:hypothetical protein